RLPSKAWSTGWSVASEVTCTVARAAMSISSGAGTGVAAAALITCLRSMTTPLPGQRCEMSPVRRSPAPAHQAFLDRPAQLLPHRQLVPVLDELGQFTALHPEQGAGRPAGRPPGRRDTPVRLAGVAPLGGVPQRHPVPLGEQHVEADEVQVVDLL